MEPNGYQKKVLHRLRDYLRLLDEHTPANAYRALWESLDVSINPIGGEGMPTYCDTIRGVPHICFKVPTGGGKTFLATCAIQPIKDAIEHKITEPAIKNLLAKFDDGIIDRKIKELLIVFLLERRRRLLEIFGGGA